MYTDEQRVRWLTRRELAVIYLTCQEKSIHEIAALVNKDSRTVQHYRTRAYAKLGLTDLSVERKHDYLKNVFWPIIKRLYPTFSDIQNHITVDPRTGAYLIVVEKDKGDEEVDPDTGKIIVWENLALRTIDDSEGSEEDEDKSKSKYLPPPPQPTPIPPPRRHWITYLIAFLLTSILLVAGGILYILWRQGPIALFPDPSKTPGPTATLTKIPSDTPIPVAVLPPANTATVAITPTITVSPTITLTPTITFTPTETLTVTPIPSITIPPRVGEVNLLKADAFLPVKWLLTGKFTYWQGFILVKDEAFIDFIVQDLGDNEGNRALDTLQLIDPQGNIIVDIHNREGNFKQRIETFEKPGLYMLFLQDNDTGSGNGNGGTIIIEGLKDQNIYVNRP